MPSLSEHRKRLDQIDRRIVELLAERLRLSRTVASFKKSEGVRLRDRKREAELLARLSARAGKLGLPADAIVRVFQEILNASFHEQIAEVAGAAVSPDAVKIAYQGVPGAYSEWAAERWMSARRLRTQPIGFRAFEQVASAVVDGRVRYGVLPIENTLAGSINEAYDLLKRHPLYVVGEEALAIDHCLAATVKMPLHEIKRVYSHPQALAQCSEFLATLAGVDVQPYFDTAAAMQKVAADRDPTAAAIAGEHAAERYGLVVLKRHITDNPENYTRFLMIAAEREPIPAGVAAKTSLIVSVHHKEGALLEALRVLHDHGINMTKLESRPRPGTPWQYYFYVDFEGSDRDPNVAEMLKELARTTTDLRVLGSYVSRTVAEGRPVTDDEIRRYSPPRRRRR
jgi:chorismate mutase/prephenate dehydratase